MTLYLRDPDTLQNSQRVRFRRRRLSIYERFLKRPLDVLVVLLALPLVLPCIGLMLFLVSLDGHAPLYRQRRLGRDGRIFSIMKIRTMVPDADDRLTHYLASDPDANQEWQSLQKLSNDPRITRFGHILRKFSFDELPQLWNVLTGDMSLVGPRPMMVEQRDLYPGRAYFEMRPGITGSWQVSDRNNSTFADRAIFDTAYQNKMSLGTDLVLLAKTVTVVFRGGGW